MTRLNRQIVNALFAATLLLGLAACGETDKGKEAVAGFKLFSLVPADTPYVFASSREFPRELSEKLLRAAAQDFVAADYRKALMQVEVASSEEKQLVKLADALVAEVDGKLSPEGLASLGFPVNGRSMLYGLGILPVAWVQIIDKEKVEAFLDRVEQRSGLTVDKIAHGDGSYRRYKLGDGFAVLTVKDDYLIMALMPGQRFDELLPLVFGEKPPQNSLADAGTFKEMVARHSFHGYGDGYIDLVRLVEMSLGEAGGINAEVLEAMGIEKEAHSPACTRLIKAMAQHVPRLSMGFAEATPSRYAMKGVLEASPEVVADLQKLAAPVPGLGAASDAVMAIGVGINLPQLRDSLKAMFKSVIDNGKGCQEVDEQAIAQAMQTMDMAFNPMFASIKGFNLLVQKVVMDASTMEPKEVDARLLLAAQDPRGLLGMLGMFSPQLATLQVPDDGSPVQVPLADLAPGAPPTWVAVKGEALALLVGDEPPAGVSELLTTPVAAPMPLFALSYDAGKLFESVGPSVEKVLQFQQGEAAEELRGVYDSMKQSASVYGRIDFQIVGADQGLEFKGSVELN